MTTKILALPKYHRLGASSRLRMYQYLPILERQDFKFEVCPFFDQSYLPDLYSGNIGPFRKSCHAARAYRQRAFDLLSKRNCEAIWLQSEFLPWLPDWLERLFLSSEIPYVVEYDDAIFHNYDLSRSAPVRHFLGQKIDRIMAHSAAVIAGNQYLAARARSAGASKIVELPTVIDIDRYSPGKYRERDQDIFNIGWIGSPSTVKNLRLVEASISRLSKERRCRFTVVGALDYRPEADFDDVELHRIAWSEESEVGLISEFDVGIMPLPDLPWERGKCGYKLIQYMACARPVVASNVGANMEIVDQGETGYLAASSEEFYDALLRLCDNRQMALQQGQAGRAKVEAKYNLGVTAPRLAETLLGAARGMF